VGKIKPGFQMIVGITPDNKKKITDIRDFEDPDLWQFSVHTAYLKQIRRRS